MADLLLSNASFDTLRDMLAEIIGCYTYPDVMSRSVLRVDFYGMEIEVMYHKHNKPILPFRASYYDCEKQWGWTVNFTKRWIEWGSIRDDDVIKYILMRDPEQLKETRYITNP